MAGVVTAGLRLVSVSETRGIRQFTESIRRMRIDMLGFEQVNAIMLSLGQSLARVASSGFKAFGLLASKGIDLDAVMTQIAAVGGSRLNVTVNKLRDNFLRMSSALPLSATELGKAGKVAVRFGIQSEKTLNTVALLSGKLGALGDDLSEAQAAEQMLTLANNMDIASENGGNLAKGIERLANRLALLDSLGRGTAKQIAEVSSRASGAARNFRLTSDQLLGLSTAALNTGASQEVAGTALNNFLTILASQTDRVAAAIGKNATEVRAMIDAGRGIEVVTDVLKAFRTNADGTKRTTTEVAAAMRAAGLGGRRLGNVVGLLSLNLDKVNMTLKESARDTNELEKKYLTLSSSMQQTLKKLRGTAENLAITFGLQLKPFVIGLADALNEMLALLARMPNIVKLGIMVTLLLSSALVGLVGTLALVVAGIGAVLTAGVFLAKTGVEAVRSWKTFARQMKEARAALLEFAGASAAFRAARVAHPLAPGLLGGRIEPSARGAARERFERARDRLRSLRGADGGPAIGLVKLERKLAPTAAKAKTFGKAFQAGVIDKFTQFRKMRIRDVFSAINRGFIDVAKSAPATLSGLFTGLTGGAAVGAGGAAGVGASIAAGFKAAAAAAVPVLEVVALIAAVILAIVALAPDLNDLGSAFVDAVKPIGTFITGLASAVGLVREGGSLLEAIIGMTKVALAPAIVILKVAAFLLRVIGVILSSVLEGVLTILSPVGETVNRLIDGFSVMGTVIMDSFRALFGISQETDLLTSLLSGLKTVLDAILTPLVTVLGFIVRVVATIVGGLLGGIFEGFVREFGVVFEELFTLGGEIRQIFSVLGEAFDPLFQAFAMIGKELGLTTGEFDGFGVIVQLVSSTIRLLLRPLTILLRLFVFLARIIGFVFLGFAVLFKAVFRPLFEFIKGIAEGLTRVIALFRAFREGGASVSDTFKFLFEGFGRAVGIGGGTDAKVPGASSGAITTRTGLVNVHPREAIIPLKRLPEVARSTRMSGGAVDPPGGTSTSGGSGLAPVNMSLTIPVTVMLEDVVLGQAMVTVSDEMIRRQFGARGIRLAGIG